MLEFNNVSMAIGKHPLTQNLSVQLQPGQLHVIIGQRHR